MTLFYRRECH